MPAASVAIPDPGVDHANTLPMLNALKEAVEMLQGMRGPDVYVASREEVKAELVKLQAQITALEARVAALE